LLFSISILFGGEAVQYLDFSEKKGTSGENHVAKQEVVPIQDEPEQKEDSHHVHGAQAAYTVEKAMQEALDVPVRYQKRNPMACMKAVELQARLSGS